VVRPLLDEGHLLERLVWVLKAEHWMPQDRNLREKTVFRTQILQDLNVGQLHYENCSQVGSQGSGQ
jgi:hypothetical protein